VNLFPVRGSTNQVHSTTTLSCRPHRVSYHTGQHLAKILSQRDLALAGRSWTHTTPHLTAPPHVTATPHVALPGLPVLQWRYCSLKGYRTAMQGCRSERNRNCAVLHCRSG